VGALFSSEMQLVQEMVLWSDEDDAGDRFRTNRGLGTIAPATARAG
jgi:hypothetical protein